MHHTYTRVTDTLADGSTILVLRCLDCGATPTPPVAPVSPLYLGGSICQQQRKRLKAELKAQGFTTFQERMRAIDPTRFPS
jgi:hypothetical protein